MGSSSSQASLAPAATASAILLLAVSTTTDALVLPSPLASSHSILLNPDARHGSRRHQYSAASNAPGRRRHGVCLSDPAPIPLNIMSMDTGVGRTKNGETTNTVSGAPDPINITTLADPGSLDVINWVDAAEVAAHVEGHSRSQSTSETDAMAILQEQELMGPIDFLPKALPIVDFFLEEEVVVIESPEEETPASTTHELAAATDEGGDDQEVMESSAASYDHPSIAKIVKFTLPAIGVWLCSPVLSMIDTASVGLLAGTAQQAALNPAVSVTDYGGLLVAFMFTATTNLIAGAVERDQEEGMKGGAAANDGSVIEGGRNAAARPRTTKTLVTALRLALLVGIAFGSILGTAAPILLKMLIGNSSLDPTVFQSALRYVQIRSLGMPAAVVIGTAQSACLGMKDVKSPLYVLAAAAGINLLGDILLVPNASPWLGGAAGAAWATVLSQYGALIMFLRWLTVKSKSEGVDPMEMIKDTSEDVGKKIKVTFGHAFERGTTLRRKLFSSKEVQPKEDNAPPARGFLSNSHKPTSILNPLYLTKSKSTIRKFLPFVIPVTTTSIGRVSGYVTMSHVASSAFGTLDMAAHQIAISIFCCLAPVVDALNQVAQSFVPGIFARKKSRARALALRKTSINFAKVGAMFGSVIVALVALGVPVLSKCFTTDPAVLSRVKNAIPGIAIFLGFDGLMCISEGTLLGQKDLKFLRNMYASFFFLVPTFMLRLKRRALNGIPVGIGTMWGTFSAYEVVRTILWLARVAWLQYRTEREVDEMEESAALPAAA